MCLMSGYDWRTDPICRKPNAEAVDPEADTL